MKGFLYGQTEYNLLNNAIHLKDYIQSAVTNHFSFLSITDTNLYGCYKFYCECVKNHIKPIIGLEIKYHDEDGFESILLAYAKTNLGFQNLLKINTYLNTNESPTGIDFLQDFQKDLMIISVYNESIFERLFYSKAYSELDEKLMRWNQQFDFYIGYSYTNRLDRLNSNQEFKDYAQKKQIRCVPIHQCRYLKNEDSLIYESLTKIAGKPKTIETYEDYSFDNNPQESEELDCLVNSIHCELFLKQTYLPKYPNTNGVSAMEYLKALCQKGLSRRLQGQVSSNYQNRMMYELSVIDKMGYADYFLIVWDFILWAKKKSILVGPGRGSAAGSLVAYCLGITDIDPLKYGLLFERFLNPERISMPDIDTDFPDDHRDEVIQYVKSLYGEKHVCHIAAFNTFLMRSSIRDLGRILKMDNYRLDEMIKLIDSHQDYDALLEEFKGRKDVYNFLYIVRGLEGLPRHISTHAAGIIISSVELDNIIPLEEGLNGLYQSQLEASDLEKIGLLKMDFLGIRNLTMINSMIQQIPNFSISQLRNVPLADKMTFDLLQRADTLGIFQLESEGIRRVLVNLKCESFSDLVAVLALYRPGPMDNIAEFIARKHGKPFQYIHPILEPILKETYGIIVYQEQIMMIAQKFSGFSLGQADLLRRAVSKKKESELKELKEAFIRGALQNGYPQVVAVKIYEYILKFANYGFNKSHSVAYGLLCYQMAYLKAHYFHVFISKILNNVIGSTQTMQSYLQYAKAHGVMAYKPNVNISTTIFEIYQSNLFLPLQTVHSIGETIATDIVKERHQNGLFKNYNDFKSRTKISSAALEALIYAGALDGFGMTKRQMIESKEKNDEILNRHLEDQIIDDREFDFKILREKEKEYLGFNLTYDLFVDIDQLHRKYQVGWISPMSRRAIINFTVIKEISTKKKDKMLVGTLSDGKMIYDFVIFPSDYQSNRRIDTDCLYLIDFKIEMDQKSHQNKLILKNVMQV